MRRAASLTVGQRVFVWTFRRMTTVFAGFPDPFVEEHVRMEGVRGYLRWAKSGMELLALLEKRFGAVEAQLIIGFAALWSGCRWCGIGHVLAANLELFKREEGALGPLDELRVPELQMEKDPEVLAELLLRFSGPRWEKINRLIERQYLLRTDQVEAESLEDELLQTTNVLWEWVVECTITAMDMDPSKIPPQAPIGKDRKLRARYYEARKQKALEGQS
jgi:hypothetical protein